jgi:hypothetical protein
MSFESKYPGKISATERERRGYTGEISGGNHKAQDKWTSFFPSAISKKNNLNSDEFSIKRKAASIGPAFSMNPSEDF